jgi:hypothetical protein
LNKFFGVILAFSLSFGLSGCVVEDSGSDVASESSDGAGSESSETEEVSEQPSGGARVGDTQLDPSGVSVTLLSVKTTKKSALGSGPDNDYFLVARFQLENESDDEVTISSLLSFSLDGASGKGYSVSIFADLDGNLDGSIRPGRKMLGEIAFDASSEELYYLVVKPSLFSDGLEFEIFESDLQ